MHDKNLKGFHRDRDRKKNYYRDLRDWWTANDLSEHAWAWLEIAAASSGLWTFHTWLFFAWLFAGWLPSW